VTSKIQVSGPPFPRLGYSDGCGAGFKFRPLGHIERKLRAIPEAELVVSAGNHRHHSRLNDQAVKLAIVVAEL
jgi:hypothetical protein